MIQMFSVKLTETDTHNPHVDMHTQNQLTANKYNSLDYCHNHTCFLVCFYKYEDTNFIFYLEKHIFMHFAKTSLGSKHIKPTLFRSKDRVFLFRRKYLYEHFFLWPYFPSLLL